jgi:peptidoglycan/LPS O-acetylase OafA/YrhL
MLKAQAGSAGSRSPGRSGSLSVLFIGGLSGCADRVKPSTPGSVPLNNVRVPYLDGLRGIAILLVISLHFLHLPFSPARHPDSWFLPLYHLLGAGWIGVDLFFVLSGFLLGGILIDHREAPNVLRVFYLRRVCRILPAYFLLLSPLLLVPALGLGARFPALAPHVSTGAIPGWTYPLFAQNLAMTVLGQWGEAWVSTTWSLAVEEQFYLLLPALILLTPPRRLPGLLIGLALLAPLLRTSLRLAIPSQQAVIGAYTMLPCRWDSLLLGVLVAWLVRDRQALAWLGAHPRILLRGCLLAGGLAIGLILHSPSLSSLLMGTVGYSVFAVFFALLVLCAHVDQLPGRNFLEWNPLRWVGRVSYTLYLTHALICGVLFHLITHHSRSLDNLRDAGLMAVSFILSLLVAGLSWNLFEQPILNLARRVDYRAPVPAPRS